MADLAGEVHEKEAGQLEWFGVSNVPSEAQSMMAAAKELTGPGQAFIHPGWDRNSMKYLHRALPKYF